MNVSEELKAQAIKLDLCKPWTEAWDDKTLDELVLMYIEGLDFAILNNYPSNEFIKENFGEMAERHGVYTDKKEIQLVSPNIVVLNGDCTGEIHLVNFDVCQIYVRHDSKVKIKIADNAMAFIRMYDSSHVSVENKGKSRSFVYYYNGVHDISGDVLIRKR